MTSARGSFEVELFPPDVDDPDHPYAAQFRELLEEAAQEYDCRLLTFDVHQGTVTFAFDSDALNAAIVGILKDAGKG